MDKTSLLLPAEWAPQKQIWTAWPSHADLWEDSLEPARREVAAMIRALADPSPVTGAPKGTRMAVLAHGDEAVQSAEAALGRSADVWPADFGDIWLRDTGPIFLARNGVHQGVSFNFNGWGGKYSLPHDDEVAAQICGMARVEQAHFPFTLEGGAVDHNGQGVCLTTRECVLNPNRNVGWTQALAEAHLRAALGFTHFIWIEDGLINDHTDGHVDNIARFVGVNTIVCQHQSGANDPHAERLRAIAATLRAARNADGTPFEVIEIPSPGAILDEDGEVMPASHMNFLITDHCVVVPTYEEHFAARAIEALKPVFPGRDVIGLPANHILSGGGSFHCITQHEPDLGD